MTEYITIDYDTVVVNSSDNNSGDSKASPVTANYNGGTMLSVTPSAVQIAEPNISLAMSNAYSDGYSPEILFTLTNL